MYKACLIQIFCENCLLGSIPIPLKTAAIGGRFLNPALPSATLPTEAILLTKIKLKSFHFLFLSPYCDRLEAVRRSASPSKFPA
jgi:hypothetical protein